MPDVSIGREPTAHVDATIENASPDTTVDREPAGRVTADLESHPS